MAIRLQNLQFSSVFALIIVFTNHCNYDALAQSPKKLLANGYYEQAFLDATKKQNKKVKIKQKYTEVIYKSYDLIYKKGNDIISSSDHEWQRSYDQLIRVVSFRSKVKHPGVYDNLQNMLYDENALGNLSVKYNHENKRDLDRAVSFESEEMYIKALDIYHQMKVRQGQAEPITTFKDRIELIDTEGKINAANQKIGDQYIKEAQLRLFDGAKDDAQDAIGLINKAKSHRPLNSDEEELLKLANLIIRDSWMQEAKNLLYTNTKRNGRLAYELINKTRSIKSLTTEEEQLLQRAQELGMTNVLVVVKGNNFIHTSKNLSGILNKERSSNWITYYSMDSDMKMDFHFEITESKPKVVLGDIRKRLEQRQKKVDYYENETDATGKVVKVKKTKNVTALVAILSRSKDSRIDWTASLIDQVDDKIVYTESHESVINRTNEFASVESGDILALPDNIETDISLDSQPFPSDKEMSDLVTQLYLKELKILLRDKKDHLLNIDLIQE